MFGFRYIKTEPTQYVIQYRDGEARRQERQDLLVV